MDRPSRTRAAGVVDFANQRGDLSVIANVTPTSTTTTTVAPANGGGSVVSLQATSGFPLEERWIDGYEYEKNGGALALFGSGRPWTAINTDRLKSATSCQVVFGASMSFPSPFDMLNTLRSEGVALTALGAAQIDGAATTHWDATTASPTNTSCAASGVRSTSHSTLDLWTDTKNRVVRMKRVTTTVTRIPDLSDLDSGGHSTATTTSTTESDTSATTIDFSDFGTAVDVQAPPADQVQDITDVMVAMAAGPGTVPADGWRAAAHGEIGGKPWTVSAARTTTGYYCYDATNTPQSFNGLASSVPGGMSISNDGNTYPKHDGHDSDCQLPDAFPGVPGAFDAFVNMTDGNQRILVGATTTSGNATLELSNGTRQSLTVDAPTRIVEWSAPTSAPSPVRIHVGTSACRVDGKTSGEPGMTPDPKSFEQYIQDGNIACDGASPTAPFPAALPPGFAGVAVPPPPSP